MGTFTSSVGSQEILTPRQPIASLVEAQTIYLRTQVLESGIRIDPQPIAKVITQRFRQVGYEVVTDINAPHDVTVYFQCEEPTRIKPLTNSTVKYFLKLSGPPCVFHYAFQETPVDWQRIDTIVFNEGVRVAKKMAAVSSNSRPLPASTQYLELLDFPLLLSAEWGQVDRLVAILDAPTSTLARKQKVVNLLGEIRAEPTFPRLLRALDDPDAG